jgi:hypothetical protein
MQLAPKNTGPGGIYNNLAQHEDPYRNPIILIPGCSAPSWSIRTATPSYGVPLAPLHFFLDNLLYILLEKPRHPTS